MPFGHQRRGRWRPHGGWPPHDPDCAPIRRRQFLYRVGGLLLVALVFGAAGLVRFLSALAERAGLPISPSLIALAVLVIAFAGVALFVGGMRRVGMPLGDIVDAADRVGRGDFSARLIERGPPFLRSVARAFNTMTTRLEAHERQRRDLMADVAHELRTPLTVMRGRLEGLVDGVYPRDDRTLAQLVEETRHLERLVEDLRTLAHAEGRTLELHREPTDLGVLLQEVVNTFAAPAGRDGVELTSFSPPDMPLIDVDPVRIREVLDNLLANALRHTPNGGRVTLGAAQTADRVRIAVADTGSGIHPDDLPRVFDRFAKGVDSVGSGLGLAIARSLVVAHGGEITAESDPGNGTTIALTLPIGRRG